MARSLQSGESTTTECGFNYQLLAVMYQSSPMASEMVKPIDWSHPPPSWAVPPEHLVHSINQGNARKGMEMDINGQKLQDGEKIRGR